MCGLDKNMHQFDMLKHALRTILTMQRSSRKFNCKMNRNDRKSTKFNLNESFSQSCDNAKNLKQLTNNSEVITTVTMMVHDDNTELANTQRKRLTNSMRNQSFSQNHSEMHKRCSNKFLRTSKLEKLDFLS